MGKKGLGRNAFVRKTLTTKTELQPPDEPAPEEAPVSRLQNENTAEQSTPEASTSATQDVSATIGGASQLRAASNGQASTGQPVAIYSVPLESPGEDETRGQMVQRHKREAKLHKEAMKKLGKKRKEEIAKLEKELEDRHAAELRELDARMGGGSDDQLQLADGLYGIKLGDAANAKRPTRAQRRRGAKADADAERAAELAAEAAAAGDSERVVEAYELGALLRPLGLAVRDIPPDGNCMYRAVEDQLALQACGDGDSVTVPHVQLRAEAARYMRAHIDAFLPYFAQEDSRAGDAKDLPAAFEQFCADVEGTPLWGSQLELGALAHVLQRRICVHSVGLPVVEMGEEYAGGHESLRLCYLRHAYGLGEHYNSIGPLQEEEEGEDDEDGQAKD